MGTFRPGWRIRAYAPRSVDATEQTVLTPAAGAPHSDPFQYASVGPLRANLIANPQLDVNADGWNASGASGSRTTGTAFPDGVASYQVTTTNVASSGCYLFGSGTTTRYVLTPGAVMGYSIYVYATGAAIGKTLQLKPHYYLSGNTGGGTPDASAVSTPLTLVAGWNRLTLSHTVPASMTRGLLACYTDVAEGIFTFYAAGAMVEVGSSVGRYNAAGTAYLGYLKPPRGRQQTLDFLSRKQKGGAMSFTLVDKRTTAGGSNASRHVSAFMGDVKGMPLPLGMRLEADFCEDVDAVPPVWDRWYTGRIDSVDTESGPEVKLDVVDAGRDLEAKIFRGLPHANVTYASRVALWPLGRLVDYGPFLANAAPMRGTLTAHSGGVGVFTLTSATRADPRNLYTAGLKALGVPVVNALTTSRTRFTDRVAVRIKHTSGASSGQTIDYDLGGLDLDTGFLHSKINGGYPVAVLFIQAKDGGGAIPADGVTGEVSVVQPHVSVDKETPLLLSDQHPAQFIKDALLGYFSPLNSDGSVKRAWPYDATSFAAILADTTFQTLRFVRDKPIEMSKFFEEVCLQSGLGYYLNEAGAVALVDLRMPSTTAGVASLGQSDLVAGEPPSWSLNRSNAITVLEVQWAAEAELTPAGAIENGSRDGAAVKVSPGLIVSADRSLRAVDFGRLDLGDKEFVLKATGIRVGDGELEHGVSRELTTRGRVLGLIEEFRNLYGYGPMETVLSCRRTTVPKGAALGGLLLATLDKVPNPGTNQRGGTRLVRVMEKNEAGAAITLRVLDMGPNAILNAPTVGALSGGSGSVTFTVTLNAQGDPVSVELAATDTSVATAAAVPVERWSRSYWLNASKTLTIGPLPAGQRIWVRARSVGTNLKTPEIPSGWAYPSGNDYLDMAGLTAPSGLSVGSVTEGSALLSFTNADTTYPVELLMESPSGDGLVRVRYYPAGTTRIQLVGLTSGASYGATVRLADGSGGVSAQATKVTWTATGTMPTAPVPPVLEVVGGLY